MKKKLLAVILIAIMTIGLASCGDNGRSNIMNPDGVIASPDSKVVDFEVIDNNFYGMILVDKNTNVMYYWITCNAGGITPIYNADGTLKLYEE